MKIDLTNLDFRESHHLLADAMVPRPIALVSTVGEDGVFNVAPFSAFTMVSMKPLLTGIAISTRRDGQKKDTLRNIEFSKEYVVNFVDETMAEAMNQACADYPSDVDEFKETGLTPVKADIVKAPMVGESPVSFECRLVQILEFGQLPRLNSYVIGEIIRAHIKDEFYVDGEIQTPKMKAVGRLGGDSYCRTRDVFEMKRPGTV